MWRHFLPILALFVANSFAQDYKAAVYNYDPSIADTPKETVDKNLNNYRNQIQSAKADSASIIVFPEYGLTGLAAADRPAEYAIYLNETSSFSSDVLRQLADSAAEHGLYVVVNLLEKERTQDDKKDIYFNTNLVFGSNGNIIAKYRKINLYNEGKLTPGNETVTFDAFGVRFGLMTCFDILHYYPSRDLIEKGATEILYPVAWRSTIPFFSALSVQQGYAASTAANLIAANYDEPSTGHGGSGIYSGNLQIQNNRIFAISTRLLITSKLSKANVESRKCASRPSLVPNFVTPRSGIDIPNTTDMDKYVTSKVFNSKNYKLAAVDFKSDQPQYNIALTHGKVSCNFNITIEPSGLDLNEIYKVMAFDGQELVGTKKQNLQICSFLICKGNDDKTCGDRHNGTTVFKNIEIRSFLNSKNVTFYQPSTLKISLEPMKNIRFCTNPSENHTEVQYSWIGPDSGIVEFAFVGITDSGASFVTGGWVLVAVLVFVNFFY